MNSDTYPYLYDIGTERTYPLKDLDTFDVSDAEDGSPSDSSPLFRVAQAEGRWFVLPLRSDVTISLNQLSVSVETPLEHLGVIQADRNVFVFVEREDSVTATAYSANLWLIQQLRTRPQTDIRSTLATQKAPLGDTMQLPMDQVRELMRDVVPLQLPRAIHLPERRLLIGRDETQADICLPDVRVSRVHAWIAREGKTVTITDLKSTNETFVDGQAIQKPTVLQEGSRIQIGPHTLILRGDSLHPLSHDNNVELVARNLTRRVRDRKQRGATKVILDDVSLVIRPGEFACILGPSGSGKTTLLSALSARVPADQGTVLLNGEDLYAHFDALKQNLAVVPQRDVLHDVLPLHVALWYTAKLRLPADMSDRDIDERIDATLDTVSLVQRRFTRIRQLSGGQIKRASWANEAISNPSLIFLDEVTSGLDEQADAEMMSLFRRMADEGKTMVCITHSLSNVEQNCHLVVILAEGGALAFVGSPAEALQYFDIAKLGDVYQRLRERTAAEWKLRFRQSRYHDDYVQRRLPRAGSQTLQAAKRWQARELLAAFRQFQLLLRRYLAIQGADPRSLAMIFGQSLVIAGLLVWLFGDIANQDVRKTVAQRESQLYELAYGGSLSELSEEDRAFLEQDEEYVRQRDRQREELTVEAELALRTDLSSKLLFLLCISCIWFGCNNAAKEIVKERTIYDKERDAGLKVTSYYASKFVLLGVISVLQASLFYWLVNQFTQLGGSAAQQWLLLSLSSLAGVSMGLAISAIANTEDLAATIVPLVLIPQIILAGLIAPLLHYTREFSQLCVPAYWSFQGLLSTLEDPLPQRLRDANYLNLEQEWTAPWFGAALLAYILVFTASAVVALRCRD